MKIFTIGEFGQHGTGNQLTDTDRQAQREKDMHAYTDYCQR